MFYLEDKYLIEGQVITNLFSAIPNIGDTIFMNLKWILN